MERRTGLDEYGARRHGRGQAALATLIMVAGMFALAVPVREAGGFLILAGVFDQGWGYAVIGAAAIVFAAMYRCA